MRSLKTALILAAVPLWCFAIAGQISAQQKTATTPKGGDTLLTEKPKILVVYYSRSGNTRAVAQDLVKQLGADIEEIVDTKSRKGIFGWLGAGKDASQKHTTAIGPTSKDPADYGLVVLGTPIWSWSVTPAIRTYIVQNREKMKRVAFFCTMGKNGDAKTFAAMAELCGQRPMATMAIRAEEVKMRQYQTGVNRFAAEIVKIMADK